jgi:hypothetical protein
MNTYKIHVLMSGDTKPLPYQGESTETVKYNYGGSGYGHSANMREMTKLKFGNVGEPSHEIGGETNLKSHMDRIARRIRAGLLNLEKIIIDIEKDKS